MNRPLLDPAVWQQVSPYLDRALDLPASDREGWLTALFQTKPDIAGLVRELLVQYDDLTADGFLEQSPLAAFERTSLTGKRIGAYTIEYQLGRGGMGEVWLASRHDGRFEGRCAIKLLDESLAKPQIAGRFRREAHLLARLVHPHIARLIDAGTTEDNRQYLALEYVDGERIDHYCQSKSLTVAARVRLFVDVIAAVAHAHANLIIHRDLKPSNVLVTREGIVKLLDFGIAKLLRDESIEEDPAATRVEEIALTPDYAAPEQILGAPPSTATDVYQLGMLLYVLLTGRHPQPTTTRRADLAKAALGEELPRASTLASEPLQKELRGDLDAILAMALRKDSAERYPTAAALGEDLRRYLNGEPVNARRGGALYHARKFIRRHRLAVTGTAVAIVSLCATVVFALGQAHEAARQRDQARIQARRADAQNRFLSLSMTELDPDGKPITPAQILESSEKLLESHYGDDPDFVVDMLLELSAHYGDLGNNEREQTALAKAEAIARKRGNPVTLARVLCNRAESDITAAHADEAAAHLAEGLDVLARASNRTLADEVDCLHARASLSDARGQTLDAIRTIEQAVALLEAREPDHDSRYTSLLSHLSALYGQVGDTRKNFETVHKHRIAEEQNYGTDTQGLLTAMHNEACALRDFGEIQKAFAEETHVIQRARAHASPMGNWQTYSYLYGSLLVRLDQAQTGLAWLEQAAAAAERVGDTFVRADARLWHAIALHALHRDAEADAELDAVDRAVAEDPQTMRYEAAFSAIVRAQLLASRGNLRDARTRLEPVLTQIHDPNYGVAKLSHTALVTASRIAAAQGRLAEAEALAREALQMNESRARNLTQSADVGEATLVLAQIKLQLGNHSEGRALASRAADALRNGLGAKHSLTRAAVGLL